MKRLSAPVIAIAAATFAVSAQAAPCVKLEALLRSAPKFEDYASAPFHAKPARVQLRGNKDARRYRTALGEAAKAGPNFAGRYTIAAWGCGTGCLDWGAIDAATGKVVFDPEIRTIENLTDMWTFNEKIVDAYAKQGANKQSLDLLLFRPDSALLVMLGAPGGVEDKSGIAWLRWTGARFEPLRFVAARNICRIG